MGQYFHPMLPPTMPHIDVNMRRKIANSCVSDCTYRNIYVQCSAAAAAAAKYAVSLWSRQYHPASMSHKPIARKQQQYQQQHEHRHSDVNGKIMLATIRARINRYAHITAYVLHSRERPVFMV